MIDLNAEKQVNKRLVEYAAHAKGAIALAIVMLVLAVAAQLAGPFVAKAIINRHIMGIQQVWYEVTPRAAGAVEWEGKWYARADRMPAQSKRLNPHTLVAVGTRTYFLDGVVSHVVRGNEAGQIREQEGGRSLVITARPLTRQQLFSFYRPEIPGVIRLALIYFGLLAGAAIFLYGQQYLLQVSANRILQRMRKDVFHQIHRLPIRYFDNLPAGKVVSRITNDTEAIRDFYVNVLANVLSSIATMVGIYVALFILNVWLGLMASILIPILIVWIWLYRRATVSVNVRIRALLSEINAMLNETIQGIPIIRAFHREQRTQAEFDELNQAYYDGQTRLLRVNSATGFNLAGVFRNSFFIAIIAIFGWRSMHLESLVSFGVLYAFVDYLNRLFQPVTQVVNQLANLEQARASAVRVFELLDEPGVDPVFGSIPRFCGEVEFDHVTFSYDGEHNVLNDVSFRAQPGQTVALVGHTGSGKSSIINLLFRFYDPQGGQIRIDGVDIRTIAPQQLRQHLGIVLQDPYLFTGTVAWNVSLGDERVSRARVEQALRDVGADRLLAHLPNGWDEPVLEGGGTLSAGERQLISFARALAFDPAILVLDEATASIDSETERLIQDALSVLKRGRTTFIIAHRLSTIRDADLILVLDGGEIVERGAHDELMRLGGKYRQMYELQTNMAPASGA
ncbi:ABC transporter-like protein [Alicyclobacillus hesperidum URH17-3-68]|uniref:ABC transporter ATP-binding protein n=1 Tax=Alicyclobacillus hesperidum TaxID=89784 RepID=UPI000281B2AA|nr:ABC transporter ATP-binding protein [Alicyclobacillus hesperidum]EJY56488.1 ABC transporter-like protein [Alicyclobacillus hesperidum URH17-3-68]